MRIFSSSRPFAHCLAVVVLLAAMAGWDPANAEITNAPAPATRTAVTVQEFAKGLDRPWGLSFLPDGQLLVTEKAGQMRIVRPDGKLSNPVAGVPKVDADGQGGLLDVAVSPDFAETGAVFFSFSEPRGGGKNGTSVARAKLVLDGDDAGRFEDLKIIFQQKPAIDSSFHFGSRLVFAGDGTLFVTTGERNFARKEAQNPNNHIGKIIRINRDGSIPEDNPKADGWAPEVWSIGHRNLQGAALDPATGALWTTEHGARGGDELNRPEKGKNYGWPVISWGIDYSGAKLGEGAAKSGLEQPVYYWDPSIATSGLAFYNGDLFKTWTGNILAGGLACGCLERLVIDNGSVIAAERLLEDRAERVRDIRVAPDGAVLVLIDDANGKILRVTPAQ